MSPNSEELQKAFNTELNKILSNRYWHRSRLLTRERYNEILEEVRKIRSKPINERTKKDINRLKNYTIAKIDGRDRLMVPFDQDTNIRKYVYVDELFEILHSAHLKFNHGGHAMMFEYLNKQYKNITNRVIDLYLKLCPSCSMNRMKSLTPVEQRKNQDQQKSNNKINKENELIKIQQTSTDDRIGTYGPMGPYHVLRWQFDIIDMSRHPDGSYRYILCYRDLRTNFVLLRPMKNETVQDVAQALQPFFAIFSPPHLLFSPLGENFNSDVVDILKKKFDGNFTIHCGMAFEQDSRVIIELAYLIEKFCSQKRTDKWTQILDNLQFHYNTRTDLTYTPFLAMFSCYPNFGQKKSSEEETKPKGLPKSIDSGAVADDEDEGLESENPEPDSTQISLSALIQSPKSPRKRVQFTEESGFLSEYAVSSDSSSSDSDEEEKPSPISTRVRARSAN